MDILNEAVNLVRRYEKGDAFRNHVQGRMNLIVPVLVLCALISLGLSLGILAIMDHGGVRAFLAVIALPIVLIGSALLQIYLFFSWLELRALRPLLKHGAVPPIPWIPVGVLLVLPLLLLAIASPKIAALVVLLAVAVPVAYVQLDANSGQRP
ncbi:MAG TPA: hypothetical protein VEU32_20160 [Burkholderiales bacterium]|nr:hypothetical protein [Burkholderiales bacterium]